MHWLDLNDFRPVLDNRAPHLASAISGTCRLSHYLPSRSLSLRIFRISPPRLPVVLVDAATVIRWIDR
jgi:hypothetical protein